MIEENFSVFGAKSEKQVIFEDVLGETLILDHNLFWDRARNKSKIMRAGRHKYVQLIANAIRDPDEIWWNWQLVNTRTGEYRLRRRYLARFSIEERVFPVLAVFDVAGDGWIGVTAFVARRLSYFYRQRKGTLGYRRTSEK